MLKDLLPRVVTIARQTGRILHDIYLSEDYQIQEKVDETPVTRADYAAHRHLTIELAHLTPDIPVLSEEDPHIPLTNRLGWPRYWLIDPLDGTQEFIAQSGEFAVLIALIEYGRPILGVVYAPELDRTYFALKGEGAFRQQGDDQPVQIYSQPPGDEITIAVSRRQKLALVEGWLKADRRYRFLPLGSSSLKSCAVAEGRVDAYLRVGPTGEWDTGAVECIVREAGGVIRSLEGDPLTYNQRESLQNPDFMVLGDESLMKMVGPSADKS